jgi:ABC-type branched-subunit amino acid transport system substrate-binding protein
VGAIVADYAWGRSAQDAIEEHFEQDVNIQVAPIGADDFASYLRQFPDDLEYLITAGHPPGAVTIANQAFELGYSPDVITGANTPPQLLAGALSDDAKEVFAHIHQSDPYSDAFHEAAEGFAGEYEEQFNTHTAFGYATGQMIAAAIEEAGEADPVAIADATRNISLDTVLAAPLQYTEVGELDQAVAIYSRILDEAPSYDSDGTYDYEELHRSDPVPARQP